MDGWFVELQLDPFDHALIALSAPQLKICVDKQQLAVYLHISSFGS